MGKQDLVGQTEAKEGNLSTHSKSKSVANMVCYLSVVHSALNCHNYIEQMMLPGTLCE